MHCYITYLKLSFSGKYQKYDIFDIFDIVIFLKMSWYFPTLPDPNRSTSINFTHISGKSLYVVIKSADGGGGLYVVCL